MHFDRGPQRIVLQRAAPPLPARIETDQDLAHWREEHAEAVSEVLQLESRRRVMLAGSTVEQIRRTDDDLASARVRVERAASVIEAAERRSAEHAAREKAAQPERQAKHKRGMAARDEAERIIRDVYAPAAATIAEALARLAELGAVVAVARDTPEGHDPVPDIEALRHPPEAGFHVRIPLASAVQLPPVVRGEPDIWPRSH